MKNAIIVGSGAGGATIAKALQRQFSVTILEAGNHFKPFSMKLNIFEKLRHSQLFFDERLIQLFFPFMKIRKTPDKVVLVNGIGTGGTTTIATGNCIRMDNDLKKLGIDLNTEFEELEQEIPVSTAHQAGWRSITKQLFEICQKMGLEPLAMPKMGQYTNCTHCGRCVLGCPAGVKWDSRNYLQEALKNGAKLITRCLVEQVLLDDRQAVGVQTRIGGRKHIFHADLIVLAAGGLGTPVILENSGISCQPNLFIDPVLCIAAELPSASMIKEVSMPFVIQQPHYIISPYFDYLSYFFNRQWYRPARNIVSLMIKLADTNSGSIQKRKINKRLTELDKKRLEEGATICTEILQQVGVSPKKIFRGTINAGHPGGMMPLTTAEAAHLHHRQLPENLFLTDATLFPDSLGNPPILTIMALAKRIGKICRQQLG